MELGFFVNLFAKFVCGLICLSFVFNRWSYMWAGLVCGVANCWVVACFNLSWYGLIGLCFWYFSLLSLYDY